MGALEERVPKCIKGPKTTHTTIAVAEKQSKKSKKGPFSLYIGSPRSHPGDGIAGARRGRSLPVHPCFSSHGGYVRLVMLLRFTLEGEEDRYDIFSACAFETLKLVFQGRRIRGFEGARAPLEHGRKPSHGQKHPLEMKGKHDETHIQTDVQQSYGGFDIHIRFISV